MKLENIIKPASVTLCGIPQDDRKHKQAAVSDDKITVFTKTTEKLTQQDEELTKQAEKTSEALKEKVKKEERENRYDDDIHYNHFLLERPEPKFGGLY